MKPMKRFLFLLVCCGAMLGAADLASVRVVYFMPMSRGLDQYLANRLAGEHIFDIVTDPKRADAVFTDRIGDAFETQLEAMYPAPAPPAPAKEPAKKDARGDDSSGPALATDTVNKLANPSLNSNFGRAKGMVFLVNTKTRQVIWSTYDAPKNAAATPDLDHMASEIVSRLKKDVGLKTR